jgi:2-methylfumaryl-CoA isomerase
VRQVVETDPRISDRNPIFQRIHTLGVGEHLAAGSAVRVLGAARGHVRPAPTVGEHTDEVLMDVLGLSSAAIGKLHDAAIVTGPEEG